MVFGNNELLRQVSSGQSVGFFPRGCGTGDGKGKEESRSGRGDEGGRESAGFVRGSYSMSFAQRLDIKKGEDFVVLKQLE